jgi:hypothetical protein
MQHFNGVIWSNPLGLPGHFCKPMHQHSTSDKEEEGGTPRVGTWRDVRVWVDFIDGLH